MSAVLRAYGTDFEPDRFCSESGLEPCAIIRRGEPVLPKARPEGKNHERSGINIVLSDAEFDEFPRQVEETTAYLEAHRDELIRLHDFPGIEDVTIDFGIARRDVIVQCDYLPPALVRLAGELGLGIEISQYPVGEDEEDAHDPPDGQS
jgi:hypothetical protein